MTQQPEPLVEISSYRDFIAFLRARADQLHITREETDATGNLSPGYSGKLFGQQQIKTLGPLSFGAVLRVLHVRMYLACDQQERRK